jgi:hypothetical protein
VEKENTDAEKVYMVIFILSTGIIPVTGILWYKDITNNFDYSNVTSDNYYFKTNHYINTNCYRHNYNRKMVG